MEKNKFIEFKKTYKYNLFLFLFFYFISFHFFSNFPKTKQRLNFLPLILSFSLMW